MIRKIDEKIGRALMGLDNNSDWQVVERWLKYELEHLNKMLVKNASTTNEVFEYRGAVRVLSDFFEKKAQAYKIVGK